MKKLLSVVLALLMLAVMLPVTAMADDIPILGSDKVWKNVNPKNVQDVLDGKHGSINGTTIELSAGNYDKIEFGRATAYEDSDTKYYLSGAVSDVDTIKKDIDDHPNGGAGKREYVRSMSNVTIKAAENATVTINGLVAFGGQVNSNKWYSKDFVANRDMSETVNNNISYWVVQNWSNITFEGLNFTSAVNIESSETRTSVNGLHFESCSFNSGYPTTTSDNAGGMGIRFVSWTTTTDNLKNLTVNNCKFENCSDGVYTNPVYGVSVTNSTFNKIDHNAIAIQDDSAAAVDHGSVVITGNTFTHVSDRIIRFNKVGEDTTITISKNTSTNSGDASGEIIKATTLPEGMEVTMTNDNWGKVGDKDPVIGNGFIETTTGGTIVIVPDRTEETPKTEPEKNPTTGANDVVTAAAALMAVSVLGMAVLSRKKLPMTHPKAPLTGGFFYAPCPLSSPQNGRIFVHSYKLLFAALHPPILVLQ